MFRDLYDYKAGDWSGPSYYTPPNSSVCAHGKGCEGGARGGATGR